MAIEILRPNGAGDETAITSQLPASTSHYDKVDEVVADDVTTVVYVSLAGYLRDLYALPASSGNGIINKITIYFRCKSLGESGNQKAKASIKSGSTVADGVEKSFALENVWETFSQEWALNPDDSEAWEWADIDALQIGVSLNGDDLNAFCTQVYVEVEYVPPSRIGTIGGKDIGSIAKFCGKAMTGIVSIGGVPNV